MAELDRASEGISQDSQMTSDEGQCVVFQLSEEEFALDINRVKEIVRLPDITPVPRSPQFVSGICNLRGSVLPVIDTRTRFSMTAGDVTDHTRLLVVESGGVQTSLLVDQVREVLRIKKELVEQPPAVCRGVDKEFLTGVVKMDDGERLIMMLNLNELIAVDLSKTNHNKGGASVVKSQDEAIGEQKEAAEEEQLVSFRVADDEYAFDIAKVSEILKVSHISAVPNVPEYVLGLFTIRNHLLPILDMRGLLGLPSMISERHQMLTKAMDAEETWCQALLSAFDSGNRFTGSLNAKETPFGAWLETYNTSSVELEVIAKRIKRERADLYGAGSRLVETMDQMTDEEKIRRKEQLLAMSSVVKNSIGELKESMVDHIQEDQRTMVVESDTMTIGFLVDWVDEVLRIPKSVIDKTPAMAASRKRELKSVAKLNEGERLIMIMDESALVTDETRDMLSDIQSQAGGDNRTGKSQEKSSMTDQRIDEEQMVTFTIDNEEYGIPIMQVQEINRISEITHIPRAPHFIDGMTNLRGNVIPVINVRRLFDLEERAADDRTRIIIVDINGNRTGLRVDEVNEVLRLSSQNIEETPSIVTEESTRRLMQGICNIEDGKRMIVLLNVSEILNRDELENLKQMAGTSAGSPGRFEDNEVTASPFLKSQLTIAE